MYYKKRKTNRGKAGLIMAAKYSSDISSNVIICEEQMNSRGLKPLHFDSTLPKNQVVLINILGGRGGQGAPEVERTFSEANENVRKVYVNSCYLFGPPMLLLFIAFTLLSLKCILLCFKNQKTQ